MQTVKQSLEAMIRDLPEDATFADVHYRLHVLERIEEGLAAVDRGEFLTNADVKQRLSASRSD